MHILTTYINNRKLKIKNYNFNFDLSMALYLISHPIICGSEKCSYKIDNCRIYCHTYIYINKI